MLSIGIVTDPVEIKEIVEKLDKDANGLIDFKEFVDFLTPHAKHNKTSLEKHEAMFMQLTKKMEVRACCSCVSEWMTEEGCRMFTVRSCAMEIAPKRRFLGHQHAAVDGAPALHPRCDHALSVAVDRR